MAGLSELHKKRISKSHKGSKNHFFGKHHTEETKEMMRNTHKNKSIKTIEGFVKFKKELALAIKLKKLKKNL